MHAKAQLLLNMCINNNVLFLCRSIRQSLLTTQRKTLQFTITSTLQVIHSCQLSQVWQDSISLLTLVLFLSNIAASTSEVEVLIDIDDIMTLMTSLSIKITLLAFN